MNLSPGGRRPSPAVSAALGQVCRGAWESGELSPSEVDEFVDAARLHRIAPLAHVVTREAAPDLSTRLKPDRDSAFVTNLAATGLLAQLVGLLADVRWLTFKGASLSMSAHPVPGLRSFTDIDALVQPSQLRLACERLSAQGWKLIDYDDMLAARPAPGEMHWVSPSGLLVDLHWSMINREARRARFRIPTDELIERRNNLSLGFGEVPALDPDDALIHVCVHAALDGANRLLQLIDADGLARQVRDWPALADRARRWRAGAQVWLVLSRARAVLHTPLPADLARMLGVPSGLKVLLDVVDRIAPVTGTRSEHGLARLVARAVNPTLGATIVTLFRNSVQGIRDRIRPPAALPDRVSAGPATVEAFLTEVEQRHAHA